MKRTWIIAALLLLVTGPAWAAEAPPPAEPGKPAHAPAGADNSTEALAAMNAPPPRADIRSLVTRIDFPQIAAHNSWINWAILTAMTLVGFAAGKLASKGLSDIGSKLEGRGWRGRAHVFSDLAGPVALLGFTMGLEAGLAQAWLTAPVERFCDRAMLLLYCVVAFRYLYNLASTVDVLLARAASHTGSKIDKEIAPALRKLLRSIVVVLAALYVLKNVFGQPVDAWLAGLGIAGLAVSLASQDSLKNVFGSLTIFLDKPYAIGDRIIFGDIDGVVEDIGFRSTKVRGGEGRVFTIPNLNIVSGTVQNVSRRPFILRTFDIGVTYDTPVEKVERAVAILRGILGEPGIAEPIHPSWDGDPRPPRVFFDKLNADSLNITVQYWYAPADYWAYMEHAQRVNLRIMREYGGAGIDFAFPTTTTHIAGSKPPFPPAGAMPPGGLAGAVNGVERPQ